MSSPQSKVGRALPRRPPRSRYRQVGTDEENRAQELGEEADESLHDLEDQSVPLAVEVPSNPEPQSFIQVKTVDDAVYRIPFRQGLLLGDLRTEIARAANIPPSSQKLIFNGRILSEDTSTLDFIPPGSCVHLVVVQPGHNEGRARSESHSSADSDVNPYGIHGVMPETLVQRQMSHLHGLAWVVVVVFTLFAWRMLMTLAFDDDPEHSPFAVNLGRFLLSVFGLAVGWYGVSLVSGHRNSTFIETKKRVFRYIVLLSLLAMGYLLSTLEAVNFDKDAFFGVFLIQSTFWYCILQAQMTHRALAMAVGPTAPSTVQQAATATAPQTTSGLAQPENASMPLSHWAFQAPTATASVVPEGRTWNVSAMRVDGDVEMQALHLQPVALVVASPVPSSSSAQVIPDSRAIPAHNDLEQVK